MCIEKVSCRDVVPSSDSKGHVGAGHLFVLCREVVGPLSKRTCRLSKVSVFRPSVMMVLAA